MESIRESAMELLGAGPAQGRTSLAVVERLHQGLRWTRAQQLMELGRFSKKELASLLGESESTLRRRLRSEEDMDLVVSDRAYRVARVLVLARDLFDGDSNKIHSWLHRPQPGLGERRPIDVMDTSEGAQEVERLLIRVLDGGIA